MIEIKPFEPVQEPAVVELWNKCELLRPWNDPHQDIRRKLSVQPELFLVGHVNGILVATAMTGFDGHRGWINYLAVDPEYQRRGFGQQMMAAAEEALRRVGCPKLNLQLRVGNEQAAAFYRSLGYVEDPVVSFGKRLEKDSRAS